mmetsp:Transcript_41587/g.118098  ORF Transcript_41587/g.118098 Transcript_41587/m.118098 type:complete len:255 (-) Transcript_41587:241-1005(-)
MVAEASDEFTVVDCPADIKGAIAMEVLVLGFLCLDVQPDALAVGVLEDDLPLVRLAHVNAVPPHRRVGEDVHVVTLDVECEEAQHVEAFPRQIVDSPNEAFPPAVRPGGVALSPVGDVLDVLLAQVVGVGSVVKVSVSQQILRGVRANLQEILLAPRQPEVSLVDVLQQPHGTCVPARLVRVAHHKIPLKAIHVPSRLTSQRRVQNDAIAGEKGHPVVVHAHMGWAEVAPPHVAACRARVGGVAVRGEKSRDVV